MFILCLLVKLNTISRFMIQWGTFTKSTSPVSYLPDSTSIEEEVMFATNFYSLCLGAVISSVYLGQVVSFKGSLNKSLFNFRVYFLSSANTIGLRYVAIGY